MSSLVADRTVIESFEPFFVFATNSFLLWSSSRAFNGQRIQLLRVDRFHVNRDDSRFIDKPKRTHSSLVDAEGQDFNVCLECSLTSMGAWVSKVLKEQA